MATSVPPTPGSEAPASAPATPAPAPQSGADAIAAAAAAARELVAQRQTPASDTPAAPPEEAPPAAPAEGEVPPETPPGEAPPKGGEPAQGDEDGEDGNPLVVTIDGAREGEQIAIETSDRETADRLRQLQRAAVRGDQARAIRDAAQRMREEAEEIQYTVQLDPAGVLAGTLTHPEDQTHLLRYLLTRPGVMQANEEWLNNVLAQPEIIPQEARLAEADRLTRREIVRSQVELKRNLDRNARDLVRETEKSIETMVPPQFTAEGKAQLYQDVLGDIRAVARAENAEMVDPKRVAGLVQRRLKLLGVAPQAAPPRAAVPPAGRPAAPAGSTPPAVQPAPTPETFKQARTARFAAASAPVGAGSPAPVMPKAPAYDPSQKGGPIAQAAAHARKILSLRKPQ